MELRAGSTRLRVDESAGGRVASLLVSSAPSGGGAPSAGVAGPPGARGAGEPLELVGRYQDSPHGWGAFPMAPFAGRVRGGVLTWRGTEHRLPVPKPPHAQHGTVARVAWEVVSHGVPGGGAGQGASGGEGASDGAVLRADLGRGWPWAGHAVLRYRLEESSLRVRLEVHADEEEMPAWVGVHPWFPRTLRGRRVQLSLAARARLATSEPGIPTLREVPLPTGPVEDAGLDDTVAGVAWPVVLTWPGVARLEVSADAPWAVVFTQREEAVCVEPQTAPPDAAALGLEGVAVPGSPVALEMTWRWSVQSDDGA